MIRSGLSVATAVAMVAVIVLAQTSSSRTTPSHSPTSVSASARDTVGARNSKRSIDRDGVVTDKTQTYTDSNGGAKGDRHREELADKGVGLSKPTA
jgi:hypothetical protein